MKEYTFKYDTDILSYDYVVDSTLQRWRHLCLLLSGTTKYYPRSVYSVHNSYVSLQVEKQLDVTDCHNLGIYLAVKKIILEELSSWGDKAGVASCW